MIYNMVTNILCYLCGNCSLCKMLFAFSKFLLQVDAFPILSSMLDFKSFNKWIDMLCSFSQSSSTSPELLWTNSAASACSACSASMQQDELQPAFLLCRPGFFCVGQLGLWALARHVAARGAVVSATCRWCCYPSLRAINAEKVPESESMSVSNKLICESKVPVRGAYVAHISNDWSHCTVIWSTATICLSVLTFVQKEPFRTGGHSSGQ